MEGEKLLNWLRFSGSDSISQKVENAVASEAFIYESDGLGPEYLPWNQHIEVRPLSPAEFLSQFALCRLAVTTSKCDEVDHGDGSPGKQGNE
jgi:hypothetical protein